MDGGDGALISYFKSEDGRVQPVDGLEPGCWVEVLEPRGQELLWLTHDLGIADEFVQEACDDEETSHVDRDEDSGQILVTVDCPFNVDDSEDPSVVQYETHPLTFIFLPEEEYFITVSLRKNDIVKGFIHGNRCNVHTELRTRLFLQMLLKIAQRYLSCLRSINRQIRESESTLRETMSNDELIRMLSMEKSLVYFSTSIQGLEATVSRIGAGRTLRLYDDDRELLDDVMIEVRQAVEMCATCSQILNGVTDTFSNVISNNLNYTMRTLTVITLILSIPTGVFGFYGMNVAGLPFDGSWIFSLILSAVIVIAAVVVLRMRRLTR